MKKFLQLLVLMLLVQNTMKAQYCNSIADSTLTYDILRVELSGNGSSNLYNGTSCASLAGTYGTAGGSSKADRYSDFTTITSMPKPKLQMGNTHTLSVLTNACTTPVYGGIRMAFIDWNHDNDFLDSNEKIIMDTAYSADTFKSVQFKVPFGSYAGVTRMRIVYRLTTNISTINPCTITSANVGETEDYEVEILNCGSPAFNYTDTSTFCKSGTRSLYGNPTGGTWSIITGGGSIAGNIYTPANVTSLTVVVVKYTVSAGGACNPTSSSRTFKVDPCNGNVSCAQYRYFQFTKNGNTYSFTPIGTVPSPYTATYFWKFSNGQTANTKNATTTFTANPVWATLRICIDSGTKNICCDSTTQYDSIGCNMYCTITKVGDSLKVSATGGANKKYFNWSSGQSTEKIKAVNQGTYCVTVYDSTGCSTTCCYTISSSNPCAQYKYFTYTNSGNNYHFVPSIPSSKNASYYWSFGNGQTSTNRDPYMSYSNGTYNVKLKYCLRDTANNIICCDSIDKTIALYHVPCNINANFGWYALSNAGSFRFVDSTTPANSSYTYYWSFGDGGTSNGKNPDHAYASTGTYTVTMHIKKWNSNCNMYCDTVITRTINVSSVNPCNRFVPYFSWTYGTSSYTIVNQTNTTGFNVTSVYFTVSNGATFNYNNPSISFKNNGYYSITMTMTVYDPSSGTSCTKTITKYIYVANSICGSLHAGNTYTKSGQTISYTNTSSGTDSTSTYLYKFGNGTTSNAASPSMTYSLPGIYRTVMYVTRRFNNDTCRDSFVRIIQVTTTNPCKDSGFVTYYSYNCGSYISPVCGCDSVTYQNYCYTYMAGVKRYTEGPCSGDTSFVKLCGYVYNDANKNCTKDSNETGISNIRIDFNSNPPRSVYTNSQGFYSIYMRKGTYTVSQNLTNSSSNGFPFSQLCPSGAITVNANNPGIYCNNNFFDTTSTCPDLSVEMGRSARITPGFPSYKWIRYRNNGATAITNAVLRYRFLSGLTVLSSTSASYSTSGNVITWNLGTVPAYSSGYKLAKFMTPTSMSIGTTVIDSVWIEPISGDCRPNNNQTTFKDTCVGSWDPNDKSVAQERYMDTTVKSLDYHIRFQNTGNAPAHNVFITDDIDNNLDLNTLKVNGSSHPMTYVLEDNRRLVFEFANIMLPDSGTDYDESQGFVNYTIDRKSSLPIGVDIMNTAAIYFDFNDPVITNTTLNALYLKSSSAITTAIDNLNITLYPNPVNESATLNIQSDKAVEVSYRLFDINGRIITSSEDSKPTSLYTKELSLKHLQTGFYILNVTIDGKHKSIKIVKE